jgi:hypothetical protein
MSNSQSAPGTLTTSTIETFICNKDKCLKSVPLDKNILRPEFNLLQHHFQLVRYNFKDDFKYVAH